MLDQINHRPDAPAPQAEAARRGALPDAPLVMPRQQLERDLAPAVLARLRALLAPRLDA
ncbi:hypothetical protein [Limimaricola sp.]|uniref:hypothetical protein n=1 Tax=Limimaricola sp. TaxID=2211665 RepID=UPI0040583025